jgi:LptD protein
VLPSVLSVPLCSISVLHLPNGEIMPTRFTIAPGILLTLLFSTSSAPAQTGVVLPSIRKTTVATTTAATTTITATTANTQAKLDSMHEATLEAKLRARSGMDTIVTFAAQDSIVYSVKGRKMRLRSAAFVKNDKQTLEAEAIDLFFEQATMRAVNVRDSAGRIMGVPKFTDNGETYRGAELTYNFRTRRGTITLAETKLGEGYFFGEKVKRMNDDTFFLQDGCYTTCDNVHPHFYFKAPKMKVITKDRIFADPIIVYVEDIPIFAIPFGLFIENKSGRRSGFVIPQVIFNSPIGSTDGRGIALQGLGYYWAASDFFDAELTGTIFSKGGLQGTLTTQYNFRKERVSGRVSGTYGYVGSPGRDFTATWGLNISHSQTLSPFTNISGSLNFSSPDFNRLTQFDVSRRVVQTINSSFSISHTFDNGLPLSLSFNRTQNIVNGQIDNSVQTGTSVRQINPLRGLVDALADRGILDRDSWLADIGFDYSVNASVRFGRPADSVQGETTFDRIRRFRADSLEQPFTARVEHRPNLTITPKLGYFTITPNIAYRETWYFRRIADRQFVDSLRTEDRVERGFFREYSGEVSLSLATILYGVVNPRIFGVNSIRHRFNPSVGVSYSPDWTQDQFGMVGSYTNPRDTSRRVIRYSRYEADGGNIPGMRQASLIWNLANNFEAKLQDTGTSEKVAQLMAVNVNGSVNFIADSMRWSPIGMSFSNTLGQSVNFSGSASFDVYDVDETRTGSDVSPRYSYNRVNRFLASTGKGLVRLTNIGFSLAYGINGNSKGVSTESSFIRPQQASANPDSVKLQTANEEESIGARFRARLDNIYEQTDLYGDSSPGVLPLPITWNANFNATFNYAPPIGRFAQASVNALINASLSVAIERSWNVSTNFTFDAVTGQVYAPTISLRKDIHCWDMSLTWTPFGTQQSFAFRLGIKSGQLRDVELRKQSSPLYR